MIRRKRKKRKNLRIAATFLPTDRKQSIMEIKTITTQALPRGGISAQVAGDDFSENGRALMTNTIWRIGTKKVKKNLEQASRKNDQTVYRESTKNRRRYNCPFNFCNGYLHSGWVTTIEGGERECYSTAASANLNIHTIRNSQSQKQKSSALKILL